MMAVTESCITQCYLSTLVGEMINLFLRKHPVVMRPLAIFFAEDVDLQRKTIKN